MSRLTDTNKAYETVKQLLDQEIRKKRGTTTDLERIRETLDVAFYLLGWAQFEYLVRQEVHELVADKAKAQSVERHAWRYLQENQKTLSVRRRLDLIFHAAPDTRGELDKDYELRNEAAHNYKLLPKEAKDIADWLLRLEGLVEKFG